MNSTDLRELAPLFDHFVGYRAALTAARARAADCDCQVAAGPRELRRYQLTGRCAAAKMPATSCLTVVHLGIRTHLAAISMPVDHIGDDELDVAVLDGLHELVLTAPQLSRQEFVDQLQARLHADRVAQASGDQDGEVAGV